MTPLSVAPESPDRNLALELVRVTEAAAMAAGRWVGRGDKNGADGVAVNAMRVMISTIGMRGTVVIGEGEKDNAPMLFNGEEVGDGTGPECDVAVVPIDGTTLTAKGMTNAVSVLAVAPRGSMYDPSAPYLSPRPTQRPAAIAAASVTRTSSRARLRSGDSGATLSGVMAQMVTVSPGGVRRSERPFPSRTARLHVPGRGRARRSRPGSRPRSARARRPPAGVPRPRAAPR